MKLLLTRIKVSVWNFIEFLKVLCRYYSNWDFGRVDLYLLRSYILYSPYQISKEFLKERGEESIYAYGETPLTTMEKIVKECGIHSRDVFYELGCGRGRCCFWLDRFVGCTVYGVEYIPSFVKIAQSIKRHFQTENIKFLYQDILEVDLSNATVVYFYGTCADEKFIQKMCNQFKSLSPKTKIITISYPLTDYSDDFQLVKSFSVRFPWGEAQAYLQVPAESRH